MQITEKQPVGKSAQGKTLISEGNARNSSMFSPANMALEGYLEIGKVETETWGYDDSILTQNISQPSQGQTLLPSAEKGHPGEGDYVVIL